MDISGRDDDLLEQLLQGLASVERASTPLESLVTAARRDLDPFVDGPPASFLDAMVAATAGDELAIRRSRRMALRAVIVAATIGLGATGAAAAAGNLPDAVQDFVHDIAESIGIDIPTGAGEPAVPNAPEDAPGQGGEIPGEGIGPDGVPPGQGGEIPGEGIGPDGVPPGQGGEIPGDGVGPDEVPPGQGGETPGQGDPPEVDPPGQGGENPSDTAPGATAPGVTAPGATAPGGTAPGTTAPGAGQGGQGGQGGQSGRGGQSGG